ncbi:MAG: amino acid ABC transporter substrate-binding protein, partial [Oscillospiraceae bacterium]|nr:amino acid ABC transporter substrate-binding protein [Oscillospiraceae bacterium]
MKRALTLLLALCLIVTALAACGNPGGENSPGGSPAQTGDTPAGGGKIIKIGIFEPASGDNGAAGKQETLGFEYAHSITPTVDINGETYTIEL